MKTKNFFLFSCMLLSVLLAGVSAMAQQPKYASPDNLSPQSMANGQANGNYTYKLFVAPNKVYGYDIFRDGRIIFHQPALAQPAGDKKLSLLKKPQADKAAVLAIEKIKKGMPAELTMRDIVLITAQEKN